MSRRPSKNSGDFRRPRWQRKVTVLLSTIGRSNKMDACQIFSVCIPDRLSTATAAAAEMMLTCSGGGNATSIFTNKNELSRIILQPSSSRTSVTIYPTDIFTLNSVNTRKIASYLCSMTHTTLVALSLFVAASARGQDLNSSSGSTPSNKKARNLKWKRGNIVFGHRI